MSGRRRATRFPFTRALVSGPSMVPTLRSGDVVVAVTVSPPGRIRSGDVVLARYRTMPDLLVVKRAVRRVQDGWWLASDNTFAGGDSARHGVADVIGRVILRTNGGRIGLVRRTRSPDA